MNNKDEPTEIDLYGNKYWKNDKGEYHREDGPAIERVEGMKVWYVNGRHHRLDGPARIFPGGNVIEWFINGFFYRLDGPASEYNNPNQQFNNKNKRWYVNYNVDTINDFLNILKRPSLFNLPIERPKIFPC